MAYTSPTYADFVVLYPRFAAVPEPTFNAYLAKAQEKVGENWLEKDYTTAQELYVAHLMTLEGLGTGTESQLAAQGLAGIKSLRSGALSIDRGESDGKGYEEYGDLALTSYGRRFADLMACNFGGPVVAADAEAVLAHPLAKDWPT